MTPENPPPTGLPPLPQAPTPEALRELEPAGLTALGEELRVLERDTLAAMAPFDQRLREIRARAAQLATENRRRERTERHAARVAVREQARSGQLPTLADALGSAESPLPDDSPLVDVPVFLATGGEARLGYPTRPGSITFTDGRAIVNAATWGAARRAWADGMEPGTTSVPGVRVHLAGTRIEKVLPAGELLLGEGAARP